MQLVLQKPIVHELSVLRSNDQGEVDHSTLPASLQIMFRTRGTAASSEAKQESELTRGVIKTITWQASALEWKIHSKQVLHHTFNTKVMYELLRMRVASCHKRKKRGKH